ncbi:MAG TPA: LysR family transcriptional regulator [Stellaceae bacterium]|nr:LysR family transcriptional regulator [Stellaceae bacterium]
MNDRQLRYAHAVWHERSFSRAAVKMGVSQPTLSGQIRLLEDELGFSLFYRNSRGVEASANGQAFLESAESLVNGLSALKDFARELRGKPGTAIRIGIHSGLVQSMVPRIVRALSRSSVKIRPDVVTATARRIHRLIRQRRLDLGLVIEGETTDVPDKLIWDQLATSDIVLLVPPTHALAKRRDPIELAEISGLPLIVNEPRMGYAPALLAAFAERNLTPEIVADCDDLESLKYMIAAGGGVALVPRIAAEREIARGLLSAVAVHPPQTVSIQLLRSQDVLPPRLERFRSQFVKEIAETRRPPPAAKGGAAQPRGTVPA